MVLLEAADDRGRTTLGASSFRRLVDSWPPPQPTSLYSPNRYALQVPVQACDPPAALASAMWLWKDVLRRTGLPDWQLVRAEVLTPEEFERDLAAGESGSGDVHVAPCGMKSFDDGLADELLRRALHDAATALPGREVFLDRIRRALISGPTVEPARAVLVVDLGESLGPAPPDAVLVEIARRISSAVRPGDTVARVGSGQFGLLVQLSSEGDAAGVARRVAAGLSCPIVHEGRPVPVNAAVGVAMTAESGDPDQLLVMARAGVAASTCATLSRARAVRRTAS